MEENQEHLLYEHMAKKLTQARSITEKYVSIVHGKEFVMYPGVFSPDVFPMALEISDLWVRLIEQVKPKRVLEIGAGAGYNGVLACLSGFVEHITCTDISDNAVANIQENIDKYHINHCMTAIQSDVFDSIKVDEDKKFDLIFWNFPFINMKKLPGVFDEVAQTVFDPSYTLFEKYVSSVEHYLKPNNGRVFIAFVPAAGDYKLLCEIASKYGRQVQIFISNHVKATVNDSTNKALDAIYGIYELGKISK